MTQQAIRLAILRDDSRLVRLYNTNATFKHYIDFLCALPKFEETEYQIIDLWVEALANSAEIEAQMIASQKEILMGGGWSATLNLRNQD